VGLPLSPSLHVHLGAPTVASPHARSRRVLPLGFRLRELRLAGCAELTDAALACLLSTAGVGVTAGASAKTGDIPRRDCDGTTGAGDIVDMAVGTSMGSPCGSCLPCPLFEWVSAEIAARQQVAIAGVLEALPAAVAVEQAQAQMLPRRLSNGLTTHRIEWGWAGMGSDLTNKNPEATLVVTCTF